MASVFDSVRNRDSSASGSTSTQTGSHSAFDAVRNRDPSAINIQNNGFNEQHLASANARAQAEEQQRVKDLAAHKATMNEQRLNPIQPVAIHPEVSQQDKPLWKQILDNTGITKDVGYLGDAVKDVWGGVNKYSQAIDSALIPDTPFFDPKYGKPGHDSKFLPGPTAKEYYTKDFSATSGNKTVDKALDVAGKLTAPFMNVTGMPGGGAMGLFRTPVANTIENLGARAATSQIGSKALGALNQGLNRIGVNVGPDLAAKVGGGLARDISVGAPQMMQYEGQLGHMSPQEQAQAALEGAGYGALFGGLSPVLGQLVKDSGIGKALSNFMNRPTTASPQVEQQAGKMLALPAPRERGNVNTAQTPDVIYGTGKVQNPEPLALPQGNIVPRTRLKPLNAEQSFHTAYQKIYPVAQERMTPPLENPNELAKWVQSHFGIDNVSLNEVRKLPYEDLRQMAEMMRAKLHSDAYGVARQTAHDMGYGQIFDQTAPSLRERIARDAQTRAYGVYPETLPNVRTPQFTRQVMSGAAAPVEKVGFAAAKPQADTVNVQSADEFGGVRNRSASKAADEFNAVRNRNEVKTTNEFNAVRNRNSAQASTSPSEPNQRGVFTTLERSGKLSDGTLNTIRDTGETTYNPITNADTVATANQRIEQIGLHDTKAQLLSKDPEKDHFSPEDIAAGYRLIDEYNTLGDHESAAQVALKLMQAGTKGGQSVQVNAIYSRLTPEGILNVATRVLNQGVKDAKSQRALLPETVAQIQKAAVDLRAASGKQQLHKDVIGIFDKASSGQKLTDTEIQKLRQFTNEAKKYLPQKETPTGTPEQRRIDRIKQATSSAADAARKRLAASRNLGFAARDHGNPVVDYAIIGVDHMMTGAVKFADFADAMQKEFGQNINPHLDKVYLDAYARYRRLNKIAPSEFEKMTNQAITGNNLSPTDATALKRMAVELSQLEGNVKQEAMADLQEAFNTLREGSRGQKAASLLRSAQLGNLRTILRNEISNNAFYAMETVRRKFIATPIDIVASTVTGRERQIFFKNGPQAWNQYFVDWGKGYQYGRRGLNPGGLQSQYDLGTLAFNPSSTKLTDRLGSFLERNVGAFLKAGDYASANRAISTELYQMVRSRAHAEGFRGKRLNEKALDYFHTADDTMAQQAQKYGEYMTFQDKNFLSTAAVKLRDDVFNAGQDFGLGNVILNYPKTPANIFMRAVDYSPLGFVKFMTKVGRAAVKGDVSRKELIDSFTRALAGTGIAGMGMYLANLGLLNVLPSKDANLNTLERKAGIIPNSLNVNGLIRYAKSFGDPESAKPQKGDTYASVDWFQPLSIPMSVGAAYGQAHGNSRVNRSVNAAEVAVQGLDAAMESFGNMSVYKSIKDLVGNNYQTASQKAGKLAANAATMFIPSLSGQLRNVTDPNARDPAAGGFLGQIKGQIMNKIPGLSQKLPAQIDTFGDEKQSQYGLGVRILNSFLNPSLMGQYDPSPEAKAVLDLIDRTGETKLAPNKPGKTITFMKKTYGFTPDQYRQYQTITGQYVTTVLHYQLPALNNPDISDQAKIEMVDTLLREAGQAAKAEMLKTMAVIK